MPSADEHPSGQTDVVEPADLLGRREWPHAPTHLFIPDATYIVTCGTYTKAHLLNSPQKLTLVRNALFDHVLEYGWQLDAWAILINHYHIIARSTNGKQDLDRMLRSLHSRTAIALNKMDGTEGRQVWYRYRDTALTDNRSYMARLHYVNRNPERHKVIPKAENYPWCSMSWFVQQAGAGFRNAVLSFKIDRVNVPDDFD
jgi:putative transposase